MTSHFSLPHALNFFFPHRAVSWVRLAMQKQFSQPTCLPFWGLGIEISLHHGVSMQIGPGMCANVYGGIYKYNISTTYNIFQNITKDIILCGI